MEKERNGPAPARRGKGARVPRFRSAQEIDRLAESYENSCRGHPLEQDGKAVLGRDGQPVMTGIRPPTITGLALALGFDTRADMLAYSGRPELCRAITRAKSRIERCAEERLFDKDMFKGAQYVLKYGFGWEDAVDTGAERESGASCIVLQQLLPEEGEKSE